MAPEYPLETQVKLVTATLALHNFIRTVDAVEANMDDLHGNLQQNDRDIQPNEQHNEGNGNINADRLVAINMRDNIAQAMWDQYQEYLVRRN